MPKKRVLERYPHPKYPRLRVELRSDSRFYQAVTFIGKPRQESLKVTHLPTAFKLAEDWYRRELRSLDEHGKKHPIEKLTHNPTIGELYQSYYADLPADQKTYAAMKWGPIQHFWRSKELNAVGPTLISEFYTWRRRHSKKGKDLKPHTLHKDNMLLRQILKKAMDGELLDAMPRFPPVGKIEANPRPWLTPKEWEHLMRVGTRRILEATNERVGYQRWDALDFAVFLHESNVRVGELQTLRFRSCHVSKNKDGDKMLQCEVTGKRGTRTVIATSGAVDIFERRLADSNDPDTELIFPYYPKDAFRELLIEADLYQAHGFTRSYKSIRATSISHMLLEQPDLSLLVVARNAGTSLVQIDNYYAKRLTAEMHKDQLSKLTPAHKKRLSQKERLKMLDELHGEHERRERTKSAKRRVVAVAKT